MFTFVFFIFCLCNHDPSQNFLHTLVCYQWQRSWSRNGFLNPNSFQLSMLFFADIKFFIVFSCLSAWNPSALEIFTFPLIRYFNFLLWRHDDSHPCTNIWTRYYAVSLAPTCFSITERYNSKYFKRSRQIHCLQDPSIIPTVFGNME